MPVLSSLDPWIVAHRRGATFVDNPGYRDQAATKALNEYVLWVSLSPYQYDSLREWVAFKPSEFAALAEHLLRINAASDNRIEHHGPLRHGSRRVHSLKLSSTVVGQQGELMPDWNFSLDPDAWTGLHELPDHIRSECSGLLVEPRHIKTHSNVPFDVVLTSFRGFLTQKEPRIRCFDICF